MDILIFTNFHPLYCPAKWPKTPKRRKYAQIRPDIWKPWPKISFLRSKQLPNGSKSLKIAARFLPDAGLEPGEASPKYPRSSALVRSATEASLRTRVEKATYEPRAPHFVGYVPEGSILGGETVFAKSIQGMFRAISSSLRPTYFFDKFRLSRRRFAILEAGSPVVSGLEWALHPRLDGTLDFCTGQNLRQKMSKIGLFNDFDRFSRIRNWTCEFHLAIAGVNKCLLQPSLDGTLDSLDGTWATKGGMVLPRLCPIQRLTPS